MHAKTPIARTRLDSRLAPLRKQLAQMTVPRGGWAKAIRLALGMTVEDLANRLGVTRSVVSRLEASEQKQTIQLDSLRRVAAAMDCDLVYALVPRQPLQGMVDQQRARAAKELDAKTRTHMRLEGQDERDSSLTEWRKEHSASLISDRKLWKTRK
jgi:predicted DNA-binding mobile mystery protein A